jgi:hypothetical protein
MYDFGQNWDFEINKNYLVTGTKNRPLPRKTYLDTGNILIPNTMSSSMIANRIKMVEIYHISCNNHDAINLDNNNYFLNLSISI